MNAGAGAHERSADRFIDGKLVAAGMNAQLEILWQAVTIDGVRHDRQVFIEFLFELRNVTNIIDAFIKSAAKLRRDGLRRNVLVGNRGQNNQKLRRSLWAICLVHRDFGDEQSFALYRSNVSIK